MKKKAKISILVPTAYIVGVVALSLSLVSIGNNITNYKEKVYIGEDYVVDDVFEETYVPTENDNTEVLEEPDNILTEPTISTNTIIKPYKNKSVKLTKRFYDSNADSSTQQNSIIYYKGSYIQNKGSEYSYSETFEVVNVIDGTVKSIKKDSNLGYIVTVEHDKEITTLYQYLQEVKVSEGSTIKSGDLIGMAGKSIIEGDNNYTLHFEVTHRLNNIDPESLYTMTVEDFE